MILDVIQEYIVSEAFEISFVCAGAHHNVNMVNLQNKPDIHTLPTGNLQLVLCCNANNVTR